MPTKPFTAAAPKIGIVPVSGFPTKLPAPLAMMPTTIAVIGGLAVTATLTLPAKVPPGTATLFAVLVPEPEPVKGNMGMGPTTLVGVPFYTAHDPGSAAGANGIGVGGSILIVVGPGVYLNVFNTDWTEGMKTVNNVFYTYAYHNPAMHVSLTTTQMYTNATAMYTGTDSRTPGGLGQVTLVSPTKVVTNLTGGLLILVVLGTLTLNFVPEPGTLLLLGSGVAGLAILGRRRMGR